MSTKTLFATLTIAATLVACPTPALAGKARLRTPALTAPEAATLLWMREEEKVAHDVYVNMNALWTSPVFANIAVSEQRHFDALGSKIVYFKLTDPAQPGIGYFTNGELQALYDELSASGNASYVAALKVGALIEEVDILDLQAAIAGTA